MPDWYEEKIEIPLRGIVKYLRNHGINTECSCGHAMEIQCQCWVDGTLKEVHDAVYHYLAQHNDFSDKINFEIEIKHKVDDGHIAYTTLNIYFKDYPKQLEYLKMKKERHERMRDYHIRQLEFVEQDIKREEETALERCPSEVIASDLPIPEGM